jgi:hypothetical protein
MINAARNEHAAASPMRLEALTAGIGAEPTAFSGAIHSVYPRACNIERASGKLVGLVAREVGPLPCGFQLATPVGFNFLDYVRAGMPLACRAGVLRIANSGLSFDLRTAIPWRSGLGTFPIDGNMPGVAGAWKAAWTALGSHGGASRLEGQAREAIENLFAAAKASRPDQARGAIARLIGLGDGLTPAGDDFLVGFLAGLWSMPANGPRRDFRATVAAEIAANAHRTSAVSSLYLEAATVGEVAEPLARLAAAIGRGDANETARATVAALAVGASSGAAASHGLLLAARTSEPGLAMPKLPDVPPPSASHRRPPSAPRRGAIRQSGK